MIKGWLIGDRELVARLEAMPGRIGQSMATAVTRLCIQLQAKVQYKLSDDVLKVRTGTLRRSITEKVDEQPDSISGIVGTNVAYAAYHEYGFKGTESVKAHLRTIKKAWGKELKAPGQIEVSAHSRKVDYPAHSFLRSALAEMESRIKETLSKAAQEAINS